MNGFTRTPRRIGACCLLWLGSVVLNVGLSGSNRADAAAIHHGHESSLGDSPSHSTWSEYLKGGPSVWSTVEHPPLTAAIEASMWKSIRTDPLPETSPVVNFFLYKQSLDPSRFDHYHPRIARALAKIEAQQLTTPTTSTTTTPTTDQPQQITPPATVPEPTTLVLTIGMAGYALWWRRRRVLR